jgi:hypothetical protein
MNSVYRLTLCALKEAQYAHFRRLPVLGFNVTSIACCGSGECCTPEGLPPFRLTPKPPLTCYFNLHWRRSISSKVQDSEFPALNARQRRIPAERLPRSYGNDEPVACFFQLQLLTQADLCLRTTRKSRLHRCGDGGAQYSLASMMVRTRWVSPSFAGFSEPDFRSGE